MGVYKYKNWECPDCGQVNTNWATECGRCNTLAPKTWEKTKDNIIDKPDFYIAPVIEAYRNKIKILQSELDDLRQQQNNKIVRCHSGHETPQALWDCPVCVSKLIANLENQIKEITARRNEALRIIEEKRERIFELEKVVIWILTQL